MKGMVLAAGLGQRMRPLTQHTAKPLLRLRGRSLLDHALDRLHEAGVTQAVVNAHWQAPRVVEAMAARRAPSVRVQLESELLETGGGVRLALPWLGPDPFFVINGDAFWLDGPQPALQRLARAFDPARMDALLMMVPTTRIENAPARGDFMMDAWGALRRPTKREVSPFLFGGMQVLRTELLAEDPVERFSLNRAYDRAARAGRLFGLAHDGAWFHLSTPPDLDRAERRLERGLV